MIKLDLIFGTQNWSSEKEIPTREEQFLIIIIAADFTIDRPESCSFNKLQKNIQNFISSNHNLASLFSKL